MLHTTSQEEITWTALVISSDLCSVWQFHIFYITMTGSLAVIVFSFLPTIKCPRDGTITAGLEPLNHWFRAKTSTFSSECSIDMCNFTLQIRPFCTSNCWGLYSTVPSNSCVSLGNLFAVCGEVRNHGHDYRIHVHWLLRNFGTRPAQQGGPWPTQHTHTRYSLVHADRDAKPRSRAECVQRDQSKTAFLRV